MCIRDSVRGKEQLHDLHGTLIGQAEFAIGVSILAAVSYTHLALRRLLLQGGKRPCPVLGAGQPGRHSAFTTVLRFLKSKAMSL